MAVWHPPEENRLVSSLSFLLSRRGSHATAVSRLSEGDIVLLDGPYGPNLRQENVILVAKGVGISGVLPLMLDLAIRRYHDNSIEDKIQALNSDVHRIRLSPSREPTPEESLHIDQKQREISELRQIRPWRDSTRKIVLFWYLEKNSQMDWIQKQFAALQALDMHHVRFAVFCNDPC